MARGIWCCQKRLSKGRFRFWPEGGTITRLAADELQALLWNKDPGRAPCGDLEIMLDTEERFSVYSRSWSIADASSARADIELIRGLIAEGSTVHHLSRMFCEKIDWRKPDGGLKEMSCRVALLKMDRDGHIILPASATARQQSSEKAERDSASPAPTAENAGTLTLGHRR